MLKTSQIQMRDPFVFVKDGKYYLFGTTDPSCWRGPFIGFDAYVSADMENWEGPHAAFRPPEGFFADKNFWAPELHEYKGEFYLFASFKHDDIKRGTAILKSTSGTPIGPFVLHSGGNVTPAEWECLDGTLYVDPEGQPFIVFCHEWVQPGGGTICAMRLTDDLTAAYGEPITLFAAQDAKWTVQVTHSSGISGHVTDGPFLYRAKSGALLMLWSSVTQTKYGIGVSVSPSGSLLGPWEQSSDALYRADGGHGMIFRDLNGRLFLTVHTPNKTPDERPIFLPIKEEETGFSLA